MPHSTLQRSALEIIDELEPRLSAFHKQIWDYAEPAWREYRSAAAYVALLREEGFEVEEGSGEMPTAFCASWGASGPIVGLYAEYDASPGSSQDTVPYRQPRPHLHPYAPGFTDAHSALGVGAVTGAIALKRSLEASGAPGRIRFFGEPAEKVCGSKAVHAAKGYYDELDFAISYHPLIENTVVGEISGCLYWSVVFTFECDETEEWIRTAASGSAEASQHNSVRSPGAVDALGLMLTTSKYTRENMFPRTGLWSLNEVVLGGANATADNLPPRITQIQYSWRSPLPEVQDQILEVLQRCARTTAETTNTRASMRWVTKIRPGLANTLLAEQTLAVMTELGAPSWDESVYAFGRSLETALGQAPSDDPFLPALTAIKPMAVRDAEIRISLPPWQDCTGADDYSEYSWHTPTVRFFTAKPLLKSVTGLSHWSNNAMNGLAEAIDPTWIYGAQIIAVTALRVLEDPEALAAATAEFAERRTTADPRFLTPMLPADFAPPIDLPWPEYHTTPRGYEWVLPTTTNFGELIGGM
jgi:aminobenzoyl-glutamate utilization protein B